ncbi:2781_t:CDS:1 [Acaulospora colombiana]|uniref:2781_t:CDS:1 n=1 Tax=Acaulospora colombiana TaxID=27376 RepID=A0ACA9KXS4_9GLOM|nr:2781_t:CDS:1 [Acaulospora colombiana]
MCGVTDVGWSRDLFYLDLSEPFEGSLPSLVDIPSQLPVDGAFVTASTGGSDNSTIFIFGGLLTYVVNGSADNSDLVFTFSTSQNIWETPSISGTSPTPTPRVAVKSVIDKYGNMYLFGGDGGGGVVTYSDIYILNTIDLTWSYGGSVNTTLRRTLATGVLLNSGEILYIGGYTDGFKAVDINTVSRQILQHTVMIDIHKQTNIL